VFKAEEFPEYLLHFIWQYRLYQKDRLAITEGIPIDVISPGMYHKNSGPDFHHARVKIGETLWVGNVEIHLKSSDWFRHGHQSDAAYGTVILHVVFLHDKEVLDLNGKNVPVVELKEFIPLELLERWRILNESMFPISCAEIGRVDVMTMHNWLDRLVVERLEQRSSQIGVTLKQCKFDWQEAFHVFLFRALGAHVNAIPFEIMARMLPYKLVLKHRHSLFQLEALLFGVSGLLPEEPEEEYPQSLSEEFRFLMRKYKLSPLDTHLWKFMRMRPHNFPTLRIAQLASMHSNSLITVERFMEFKNVKEMLDVFISEPSPFWRTHYSFSHVSPEAKKKMGKDTVQTLLINAVIPFLFEYASHRSNSALRESCLEWMYELKSEKNSVIKEWNSLGIQPDSAAGSQALIHLKRNYCELKKCLDCAVGHRLLRDTIRA
jgi:hypothetical protein